MNNQTLKEILENKNPEEAVAILVYTSKGKANTIVAGMASKVLEQLPQRYLELTDMWIESGTISITHEFLTSNNETVTSTDKYEAIAIC